MLIYYIIPSQNLMSKAGETRGMVWLKLPHSSCILYPGENHLASHPAVRTLPP